MDKPIIYQDKGYWFLYHKDVTDKTDNGAFVLTNEGRPGSWFLTINAARVTHFQHEYKAQVFPNWKPPVITTDKAIIWKAGVMHERSLGGYYPLEGEEKSLTESLRCLRDRSFGLDCLNQPE